jgi:hypothetical protein
MSTPRWEGDEIGVGVGDAGEFAPGLRRLLGEMTMPDWVTEDPQVHVLPQIERALEASDAAFRLVDDVILSAVYAVTLAWQRKDGTFADLRRDVFALIGAFAENATHVQQRVRADRIEFDVVTGTLEGQSRFRTHGHALRLKVVGEAARRLAFDAYTELDAASG